MWFWPAPSSCRNSKTAPARARRKVVSNRCPKPLPQTVSDPGMRLRGDLPKSRARLLDWCANPAPSCGFGRHPPRVATRRRPAPCSELACCGGRRPRVAIAGSTPWAAASSCRNLKTARNLFRVSVLWWAASSSRYRWPKPLWPAPSSCRNSRTARTLRRVSELWSAPSSCRHRWFKPWV